MSLLQREARAQQRADVSTSLVPVPVGPGKPAAVPGTPAPGTPPPVLGKPGAAPSREVVAGGPGSPAGRGRRRLRRAARALWWGGRPENSRGDRRPGHPGEQLRRDWARAHASGAPPRSQVTATTVATLLRTEDHGPAATFLAIANSLAAGLHLLQPYPTPVVTSVSPTSGTHTGLQGVTIGGEYFTGATSVSFGGVPITCVGIHPNCTVNSDTQITVTSPAAPSVADEELQEMRGYRGDDARRKPPITSLSQGTVACDPDPAVVEGRSELVGVDQPHARGPRPDSRSRRRLRRSKHATARG